MSELAKSQGVAHHNTPLCQHPAAESSMSISATPPCVTHHNAPLCQHPAAEPYDLEIHNDLFLKFCRRPQTYDDLRIHNPRDPKDSNDLCWNFCFYLIASSPAADAFDANHLGQWRFTLTPNEARHLEYYIGMGAENCLYCYWSAFHYVHSGYNLNDAIFEYERDLAYESLLCSERLAVLLMHEQRHEQLPPHARGRRRRALKAVRARLWKKTAVDVNPSKELRAATEAYDDKVAKTLETLKAYDSRIAELETKIKGVTKASDPVYYCQRRELMGLGLFRSFYNRWSSIDISNLAENVREHTLQQEGSTRANLALQAELAEIGELLNPLHQGVINKLHTLELAFQGIVRGEHQQHGVLFCCHEGEGGHCEPSWHVLCRVSDVWENRVKDSCDWIFERLGD